MAYNLKKYMKFITRKSAIMAMALKGELYALSQSVFFWLDNIVFAGVKFINYENHCEKPMQPQKS